VDLKPLKAGGPFTMTISGGNVVTVKDLLVGDVWLCSGQSNMHFRMRSVENTRQEIAAMDYPSVRFFTVDHQFGQAPVSLVTGAWTPVSPATVADCSAVACYFGRALQHKLRVPIGLVVSSVGGTRIESWMRSETLAATGESKTLIEKWKNVSPEEFGKIAATYSAFQQERDQAHPKAVREAKAQGTPGPPAPIAPKERTHDCPSALHNGMIVPIGPPTRRSARRSRTSGKTLRIPPWSSPPMWAMPMTSTRPASVRWVSGWPWPPAPSPMENPSNIPAPSSRA